MVCLVLAGSFNPVTRAHVTIMQIARRYLEHQGKAVTGIMLPTSEHYPWKRLLSNEIRLKLCRRAVADQSWIEVSEFETSMTEWKRTRLVFEELAQQRPEEELVCLCGADKVEEFTRWKYPEDISEIGRQFGYLCIPRAGYQVDSTILDDFGIRDQTELVPFDFLKPGELTLMECSSTQVRTQMKEKAAYHHLLPPLVTEYLEAHPKIVEDLTH